MNALVTLLLVFLQGCSGFTFPATTSFSRRAAFVAHVTTELKSEETSDATAPPADEAVAEITAEEEAAKKKVVRERHTVFVGNLPFEVADGEIRDLCSEYGEVLVVTVPKNRDTGVPRGFAFVDMKSAEELQAVVEALDGMSFKGRDLRASVSDPSQKQIKPKKPQEDDSVGKVYVGNLPFDTSRESLMEFYGGFAPVIDAYIPMNAATGTGRGYAFISVNVEDVDSVIEQTHGYEYEGRPLVVSKPLPPGQRAKRRPTLRDRTKLYVGNLAFSTDVEILEEVFGEFGEVIDCYMPEDPARGGSRGFGFVTMGRDDALAAIAELNGCELDGRFIRVNEALPKGQRASAFDDDFEDGDEFVSVGDE